MCVSYYMHFSLALSSVFLVHCLRNPTKLYDFLSFFFFFFFFFLMWTIFNGLCCICYNTVSVLCFGFLPSRYVGCGILALLPENKPTPPALEGTLLTTGPPGKSASSKILDGWVTLGPCCLTLGKHSANITEGTNVFLSLSLSLGMPDLLLIQMYISY